MRQMMMVLAAVAALSARAEQKNVQLLTGMTDVQLQRTMNMMRASLGVHCDFCHVVKDEWDFASDEKPTKRTARHMIQMVEQINAQTFEGRPVVSCNTCHRGSTKPVLLVSLPQAPPPFPTPIPARPTLPPRDEVVAKYAAAVGDTSIWRAPKILKGTREWATSKPIPVEILQSGAKLHVVAETPAGHVEQAFTETGGWIKDKEGVKALSDNDLENLRGQADAYAPVPPGAIPADARVVGKESIGDRETVVVAVPVNENVRQRLFFDTKTGLLVRRMILTRTAVGEIPQQTDFDDWRAVAETKFPFMVKLSLVDPWTGATRRYTDVQLGAKVDEGVFGQPK